MKSLTLAAALTLLSAVPLHADGMVVSPSPVTTPPAVLAVTAGEPASHRVLPLLLLAGTLLTIFLLADRS